MATKRFNIDKTYNAFVTMFYYNYDKALIDDLLSIVKERYGTDNNRVSISDVDDFWMDNDGAQFVWGMLVLMFGDYGASPRIGWIYISDELINFLEDMQKDLDD